ncbi:MAG: hypothetical protein ACFCVC_03340 [Acidimicrobiia bacterium]
MPPEVAVAASSKRPKLWPFVLGGIGIVLVGFVVGLALPSDLADSRPVDTFALPDLIVPPPPTFPEDDSSATPSVPSTDRLFSVPSLPPGFSETADLSRANPDRVEQQVILEDGSDEIVIFGLASADVPELGEGESVEVRGQQGVVTEGAGGEIVLTWIEPGNILIAISAPPSFGIDQMVLLAESLEVR